MTCKAFTRNNENDVKNPSFVNSQGPPYSSSSIFWKLVKYTKITPAFMSENLNSKETSY